MAAPSRDSLERAGDHELGDALVVVAEELREHPLAVAAEGRRRALDAARRAREVEARALDDGPAPGGVGELDEVAAVAQLRVAHALGAVLHRARGDAAGLEQRLDLLHR